jgi:hypothetical protein
MDVWAVIWMALVLKIPIAALLWLVWWAVKDAPEPLAADEDDGGSRRPERPHGPRPTRSPRRGPEHGTALPAPPRVRTAAVGRRADTPR